MAFIQIIEYEIDDVEQLQKLQDEWFDATEGQRTLRRSIIGRDRADPSRYIEVAFFDSYESAMENSALPETHAAAEAITSMGRNLSFHDLDVIADRS